MTISRAVSECSASRIKQKNFASIKSFENYKKCKQNIQDIPAVASSVERIILYKRTKITKIK